MALVSVGSVTAALTLPLLIGRRGALPPVDVSVGTAEIGETHTVTRPGFIAAPVWAIIPIATLFGFALNGTSSVLSAIVAHFVPSHRRARGYGAYFTAALVSSALAPLVYGVLGDAAGLATVFVVMAAMTASILLPLAPIWRTLAAMGYVLGSVGFSLRPRPVPDHVVKIHQPAKRESRNRLVRGTQAESSQRVPGYQENADLIP